MCVPIDLTEITVQYLRTLSQYHYKRIRCRNIWISIVVTICYNDIWQTLITGVLYCPNDRNHDYRYDVITAQPV